MAPQADSSTDPATTPASASATPGLLPSEQAAAGITEDNCGAPEVEEAATAAVVPTPRHATTIVEEQNQPSQSATSNEDAGPAKSAQAEVDQTAESGEASCEWDAAENVESAAASAGELHFSRTGNEQPLPATEGTQEAATDTAASSNDRLEAVATTAAAATVADTPVQAVTVVVAPGSAEQNKPTEVAPPMMSDKIFQSSAASGVEQPSKAAETEAVAPDEAVAEPNRPDAHTDGTQVDTRAVSSMDEGKEGGEAAGEMMPENCDNIEHGAEAKVDGRASTASGVCSREASPSGDMFSARGSVDQEGLMPMADAEVSLDEEAASDGRPAEAEGDAEASEQVPAQGDPLAEFYHDRPAARADGEDDNQSLAKEGGSYGGGSSSSCKASLKARPSSPCGRQESYQAKVLKISGRGMDDEAMAWKLKEEASGEDTCDYTELDLSRNGLTSAGLRAVIRLCRCCPELRILRLFSNRIDDEGAEAIGEILRHCRSMEEIHLSHNRFTRRGIEAIVAAADRELPRDGSQQRPLWLRLEHNDVERTDELAKALERRFRSVCGRSDRDLCTPRVCVKGCRIHVPFLIERPKGRGRGSGQGGHSSKRMLEPRRSRPRRCSDRGGRGRRHPRRSSDGHNGRGSSRTKRQRCRDSSRNRSLLRERVRSASGHRMRPGRGEPNRRHQVSSLPKLTSFACRERERPHRQSTGSCDNEPAASGGAFHRQHTLDDDHRARWGRRPPSDDGRARQPHRRNGDSRVPRRVEAESSRAQLPRSGGVTRSAPCAGGGSSSAGKGAYIMDCDGRGESCDADSLYSWTYTEETCLSSSCEPSPPRHQHSYQVVVNGGRRCRSRSRRCAAPHSSHGRPKDRMDCIRERFKELQRRQGSHRHP
mmetsp:Transcript_92026/g.177370  ORF Transcript_92026/g.177370 Transcript_92026/m.177370 type:complete len:881 (+) Transcript_92026:65-2707(+)